MRVVCLSLQGKRVVVLVDDLYQELEAWYPYYALRQAGAQTYFASYQNKQYSGKYGYPCTPQLTFKELKAQEWDCVVIPGGYAPDKLRRYAEVNHFVKKMFDSGKVVAAICHGLWVPISAGILKGRKCTCFDGIKDDVANAGALYSDQEVVVDGNLVSSRKPDDLPAFCREIARLLGK